MNLTEFQAANISDGDKGRFMNKFNDPNPTEKLAYFEHDGVCYTATAPNAGGVYGPLFKLCGAGITHFEAIRNYPDEDVSPGEEGALDLHNAKSTYYQANFKETHRIASKVFKTVDIKVAQQLRAKYPIPNNVSPIVSDIQSESASVKNTSGRYITCGMCTVHRLYMATAFTILRKLHDSSLRDGVVALIVEKNGRIISWGRKNPNVPCWHGETSAIMALGGKIPAGSCVYSTLKPCKMCAAMIVDASGGDAKVFWGQNDPGPSAKGGKLDNNSKGRLLDGNKSHSGARAILLEGNGKKRTPMARQLNNKFFEQSVHKSPINYVLTDEAAVIIKEAERVLKAKQNKYRAAPSDFNENTAFVVRYLTDFMAQLGLQPENLGV